MLSSAWLVAKKQNFSAIYLKQKKLLMLQLLPMLKTSHANQQSFSDHHVDTTEMF